MKKILGVFLFILGPIVGLLIIESTQSDPEAFYGLCIAPIFTAILWVMAYSLVSTKNQR